MLPIVNNTIGIAPPITNPGGPSRLTNPANEAIAARTVTHDRANIQKALLRIKAAQFRHRLFTPKDKRIMDPTDSSDLQFGHALNIIYFDPADRGITLQSCVGSFDNSKSSAASEAIPMAVDVAGRMSKL